MKDRRILLSFDVEEFDTPLEYGIELPLEEQMLIGLKGMEAVEQLLIATAIPTTLFTTAHFAETYPTTIKALSEKHEIASHTFYHSKFEEADLLKSKQCLEQITGKPVDGLRMPRMKEVSAHAIAKAEYKYDSSINPTWLPGRYNNYGLPKTMYNRNSFIEVPASVTPTFRIPLFWLLFKNIPLTVYQQLAKQTLRRYGYLCLYFHPWEFTNLDGFEGLPSYVRKVSGAPLIDRLHRFIQTIKKEGEFTTTIAGVEAFKPSL